MATSIARLSDSSSVPWLPRLARDRARYVGIDVGIDRVRVATFGIKHDSPHNADTSAFSWLSQSEFQLPIDPLSPPPPDWVDQVVECLVDRLPRCVDGERNQAIVSLPMPWIHYQTSTAADVSASQSQCDAMFASSIFQSHAHLTNWKVTSDANQYMIAATAESAACRIAEAVSSVGYRVNSIMPHGVALLLAAPPLTSLTPSAVLLLEFSGSLIAMRNENSCGLCRNLPPCDIATADRFCLDRIEPWLQDIAAEVNATCRYAARLSNSLLTESPILIVGSAAQIPGVDVAIATMLGRPVATWRYVGRTRPYNHQSDLNGKGSDSNLAVSLSLAYCGIPGAELASEVTQ